MKKIIKLLFFIIIIVIGIFVARHFMKREVVEPEEIVLEDESVSILVINPDYLNPLVSTNKYVQDMSKLVFEGLVTINSELKPENNIAKIIEPKGNTDEYKIVLKNNIKFHDGTELTSDDIIFTINKIIKLGESCPYYYNVKNIESANKVNKYELTLKLNTMDNFIADKLTFPILPEKYYANRDLMTEQAYIGTGRYKLVSKTDEELKLEYNENYHEKHSGNIKYVTVKLINKNIQSFEVLKSDDVDIVDTDVEVGAYGRSAFNSKRYITGVFEGIIFNLESEKVMDKNVRQAILLAINRDSMIENYLGGYGIAVALPINPSSYLFNKNLPTYSFNPEKAQDLLNNTGWTHNENETRRKNGVVLSLNFLVNSDNEYAKEKAEFIASNLKDIGINVNVNLEEPEMYKVKLNNKDYDMVLTKWALSSYPEFLYNFETNTKKNYSGFTSEEYDYLVYMAKREVLDMKVIEYFSDMQELLNSYLPMAGLYINTSTVYYDREIMGEMGSNMVDVYRGIENMVK